MEDDLESKLDVVECDDDDDLLFGNLTPRDKMEALDRYLMGLSKRFMKYRLNVFLLNRVRDIPQEHIGCPQDSALVLRHAQDSQASGQVPRTQEADRHFRDQDSQGGSGCDHRGVLSVRPEASSLDRYMHNIGLL